LKRNEGKTAFFHFCFEVKRRIRKQNEAKRKIQKQSEAKRKIFEAKRSENINEIFLLRSKMKNWKQIKRKKAR
jgi:hypothetical protein